MGPVMKRNISQRLTNDPDVGISRQPFYGDGVFQDRVLWNYLLGMALNQDPPALCLLST
jgi:hypothetical protein